MCFLKVVQQKEVEQHPSAFKRVDMETSGTQSHEEQACKIEDFDFKKVDNFPTFSPDIQEPQPDFFQFQFHMLGQMLALNNALTMQLLEKNSEVQGNLQSLEKMLQDSKKNNGLKNEGKSSSFIKLDNSNYGDALIQNLFGVQNYKYQMVLQAPFESQLYKERNFDVNIKLIDAEQNLILNSNPVPISLCVYSSQLSSEMILTNKIGQPIMKGNTESQIYHGKAEFKKLHMRQVTSYYRNGWVHFVIFPKAPSFAYNNKQSCLEQVVDYTMVKPLVISEVVVRAKKKC